MRACVILLLLAGCDVFFPLTEPPVAGDAAVDSSVDAPPACFMEDFDQLDRRWGALDTTNAIPVVVQESGLEIRLPPDLQDDAFNGLGANFFDVSETSLEIEIAMPGYQGVADPGNVSINFVLDVHNTSRYEMFATNNLLITRHQGLDGKLDDIPFAFNAMNDHLWRIRHAGNRVFYETSPTGAVWTPLRDVALEEPLADVFVSMIAASFEQGVSDPGVARFDRFAIRGDCWRF